MPLMMLLAACLCGWPLPPSLLWGQAVAAAPFMSAPVVQDQDSSQDSTQEPTPEHWELASIVIRALRGGDERTLAQITDFRLRSEEGVARGAARGRWEDLDELGQLLFIQDTVQGWLGADAHHFESGTLYNIRVLEDPDAGWGPVPDRHVLQTVVKASRSGRLLDLVLVASPDFLVLDLQFGESYSAGHNPLGEAGLQPESRPELTQLRVVWPEVLDDFDRDSMGELVDGLLAAQRPPERKEVTEALHRNPRAAVAALLERILEMSDAGTPDAVAQRLLFDALETITGRSSAFSAVARFGTDDGAWESANQADLAAWMRWHGRHGGTFAAVPVENPLMPTHRERPVGPSDDDPGEDGSVAQAPPSPGREPPREPVPVPEPKPDSEPAPGKTDSSGGPRVTIRKGTKPRAPRALLREDTAALEILWGDKLVTAGEVAEQIPTPVRRLLDSWSKEILALELRVCLSGNPDHVVMGRVADQVLIDAALKMDEAWEILEPALPLLVKRTARPTLAVLFDQQASRDQEFWDGLLSALASKRALLPEEVAQLSQEPDGVMARNVPMFLQPTWDQAGNAAAGDDEFRLVNEIAHKFTQCFLTQRTGQLPQSIRWGLGHLIEIRLQNSVYQFNTSGFVAVGDHFDWSRRAERLLEKASRKRKFNLGSLLLGAEEPAGDMDQAVMVWGVLEGLLALDAVQFTSLLEALGEVHADEDPYGVADDFKADEQAAIDAIGLRLSKLEMDEVLEYLDQMN